MSLTYGFYNSVNHDRTYDALQFSSIFDGIIRDGVFMSIGSALVVKPDSGMNITVGTGRAWFNHTWTNVDAIYPLTVPQSDMLLDRIDAVVLEVNSDESVRANTIKIVQGTPSQQPVAPTMLDTEFVHQYALAHINVPANLTEVTALHITNRIGMEDVPYVSGILETVSIEGLAAKWEAEFEYWFEHIRTILSGDVAANLAAEIDRLQSRVSDLEEEMAALDVPVIRSGTEDLVPTESALETGTIYLVYE